MNNKQNAEDNNLTVLLKSDKEILIFEKGNTNFDLFIKALKMQKETDVWKKCYTSELTIHALEDNPIFLNQLLETNPMDYSEEVILSEMEKKSTLFLEYPGEDKIKNVFIRNTAITSICDRAKIGGSALRKMNYIQFADVLNICLSQWDDFCLLLYRDGKISAVHSGDSTDYSILPPADLILSLKKKLDEKFEKYEFLSAFLSHQLCCAEFKLTNKNIMKMYEPYLKKLGYENVGDFWPLLKFSTSDIAVSSVNLYPFISNGRICIQMGSPSSLMHKNKNDIYDFEENLNGIYSLFQQSIERLNKLSNMLLSYPDECFANICKKVGLANKFASDALMRFKDTRNANTTALELYMAMWEIINVMKNKNEDEHKIFNAQEKISRVLGLDIFSYDKMKEFN